MLLAQKASSQLIMALLSLSSDSKMLSKIFFCCKLFQEMVSVRFGYRKVRHIFESNFTSLALYFLSFY